MDKQTSFILVRVNHQEGESLFDLAPLVERGDVSYVEVSAPFPDFQDDPVFPYISY